MGEHSTFDPLTLKRLNEKFKEYDYLPESFMLNHDEVRAVADIIKDM